MSSGREPVFPVDVALRDGVTVRVRRASPSDVSPVLAFLTALSSRSRWLRFFSGGTNLRRDAEEALAERPGNHALVACTGGDEHVVGLAQLVELGDRGAEIAFAVADAMHGHGLGTILLAHLAEIARAGGVEVLQAEVLPENAAMAEVFRESGFPFRTRYEAGSVIFEAPAALSPDVLAAFEERQRIATVSGVAPVLRPSSIAVVGASRRGDTVGSQVLANLVAGGFRGDLHVVNRRGGMIEGRVAHRSLAEVPEPPDLVVVAVPAEDALDVARGAGELGARALVVISAGFAEAGAQGVAREHELLRICRQSGMRMVGPNCLGVLNTAGDVSMNATFGAARPPQGTVALMSQSGALGIALLEQAEGLGIGVSSFVSAGNKADLSGNDFLQYWEADEGTAVVLLYLESFGNPREFGRIARRVSATKPIVAVKSGRSAVGARAAGSHTGALLAASDVTVDALFDHAGVVRTDTLQEFLGVASLLARQRLPGGSCVAVITNAGGPAILCADACVAEGLEVPVTPAAAREELRALVPGAASTSNPIDMLASADAATYARVTEAVARGGWADAIVVIFIEVAGRARADIERAVADTVAAVPDAPPVLSVMMSPRREPGAPPLPTYAFPEEAAKALSGAVRYAGWRTAERSEPRAFDDVSRAEASRTVADAGADGERWLDGDEAEALCACWGIPLVPSRTVRTAEEAAAAAARLGFPVALKGAAPGLVHKSDAGAVRLDLGGAEAVIAAAEDMIAGLASRGRRLDGFVVQPMVSGGVEMLVGVVQDERFGPVVACGAGGVRAELERDVAVRMAPVSAVEAAEAIRSLRTFALLDGWRGAPRCDVAALEDVLERTAAMADAHPEIRELDLNPVLVGPAGATVLDARVKVGPRVPERAWPAIGAVVPRPEPPASDHDAPGTFPRSTADTST